MEFDPLPDNVASVTDVVDAEVTKTEIMFDDDDEDDEESFRVNPNAIGRD